MKYPDHQSSFFFFSADTSLHIIEISRWPEQSRAFAQRWARAVRRSTAEIDRTVKLLKVTQQK